MATSENSSDLDSGRSHQNSSRCPGTLLAPFGSPTPHISRTSLIREYWQNPRKSIATSEIGNRKMQKPSPAFVSFGKLSAMWPVRALDLHCKGSSLRNRLTEIRLAVLSSISHAILEIRAGGPRATGARKIFAGFCAETSKKFRAGRGARFHPQNQKTAISGRARPPDPDFYRIAPSRFQYCTLLCVAQVSRV